MLNVSRLLHPCLGGVLLMGAVVSPAALAQGHDAHSHNAQGHSAQDHGAKNQGVSGQQSTPACEGPASIPETMASWAAPVPMKAAKDGKALKSAEVTPGQAVTLSLLPTPDVRYPLRPEKPGGSVSHGGLARFTVTEAGTWRVALGSAAWIDVVKDGKAAPSVTHGHGPACSGIRKMVGYDLTPGTYTLQIAGSPSANITALVTKLP